MTPASRQRDEPKITGGRLLIDPRSIGNVFACRAAILAALAVLAHFPEAAAERVITDDARSGIRIRIVERQPPAPPQHGVSLQAVHELSVTATSKGVQITRLQINPGRNVTGDSGGNPVSGYLYLDAMPRKTLRALVLAEDSAQPFDWSYRIEYRLNGQAQSRDGTTVSSRPAGGTNEAAAMPAIDVSVLLADPAAPRPSSGNDRPQSAAGDLSALLADPGAPSATPDTAESAIDASLRNALVLRDQERERKAHVARAESLRSGLFEEQKLLKAMVAGTSSEHVKIDQRRAEAERRRQAQAESAQTGRLLLGLAVGMTAGVMAQRAGIANAGEIGGRLGGNIAQGNAAGGFAEYSAALNSGMSQRMAELETQNRAAMAAQPQQLTDGQRMYRESVRRSEAGRQQLIAQGKLANTPPPPTVAAVLNTSPTSTNASPSSGRQPSVGDRNAGASSGTGTAGAQQRLYSGPDSCNSFAGHWARYAGAWHKRMDLEPGCGGGQYCVQTLRDWNGPASGYDWHCSRQQEIDGGQSARVTRWSVNGNTVSVWLSSGEKLNLQLHHRDGRPWLDDMIKQSPR